MARPRKQFDSEFVPEIRLVLPRGKQVFGIVESRLGFGKTRVICTDGKVRLCRVPGAMRRDLWIRPNNIVLVEPWDNQGDERGDIIRQYTPPEVQKLREKGYIKDLVIQEF